MATQTVFRTEWTDHHPAMQKIQQMIDEAITKANAPTCECATLLAKQKEEITKLSTSLQELNSLVDKQANAMSVEISKVEKDGLSNLTSAAVCTCLAFFFVLLMIMALCISAVILHGHPIHSSDAYNMLCTQVLELSAKLGAIHSPIKNAPKPSDMPPFNAENQNHQSSKPLSDVIRNVICDVERAMEDLKDAKQLAHRDRRSNDLLWMNIQTQSLNMVKLLVQEMLNGIDGISALGEPAAEVTIRTEIGAKLIRHYFEPYPVALYVDKFDGGGCTISVYYSPITLLRDPIRSIEYLLNH